MTSIETDKDGPLEFVRLHSVTGQMFDDFMAIYQDSLLPSEQKPESDMRGMFANPHYQVILGLYKGEVIGFCVLYIADNLSFSLLEYMAISQNYRSHGFGSILFQYCHRHLIEEYGSEFVLLLEVDSPLQEDSEQNDRCKRLRFYSRLGCKTIANLDYLLPVLNDEMPPKMQLMVLLSTPDLMISQSQLREWLMDIFVNVYNRPRQDPSIEQMLSQTGDPVTLI